MNENEVLIKFKTKEDAIKFMDWMNEYGQYQLYDETEGEINIKNYDIDYENNIINF